MVVKVKNPFTPSFGKTPLVLAGRDLILSEMADAFENGIGDPNLASVFVGARGSGKTALLTAVSQEAGEHGWISVATSALPGMLDDILEQTYRNAGHLLAPEGGKQITGFEIAQVIGVHWEDLKASPTNWRSKMTGLLDQLAQSRSGLLITVDEVTPALDEMRTLVSVYQHFVREERDVALVMAGLPHKVSALLADEDIMFLRRARKHRLGRISDADVRIAFRETVEQGGKTIEGDALGLAVDAIGGYPFMMQLVGYRVWASSGDADAIGLTAVKEGIAAAEAEMREGVLESTFNDLSEGDKRFIAAMLEDDGDSVLADIATRMGKKSNYASRYKQRLLEQGVIGEYGRNVLRFEIPSSREYFAERLRS